MIRQADIEEHKRLFSNFDENRFINWLDAKPGRWKSFKTVTQANKSRRKQEKLKRYIDSMD